MLTCRQPVSNRRPRAPQPDALPLSHAIDMNGQLFALFIFSTY